MAAQGSYPRLNCDLKPSINHQMYYLSASDYVLMIYVEKFLDSDWLRAVQFIGKTVPNKVIQ